MKKNITNRQCKVQSANPIITAKVMQLKHQLPGSWRMTNILILFLFLINTRGISQVRPIVTSLTPAQISTLASDVHTFLDAPGHAHVLKHLKTGIHDQVPFLPWHRYFIGLMEDDFINTGKFSSVPLPKWDPTVTMPNDFFTGANAMVLGYPALVNQTIASADLVFTPTICNSPTRAILTNGDGGIYAGINHTIHDNGHVRVGGAMGNLTTAAGASVFYLWHGYIDDIWKQWECNCSNPADSLEHIYGVDLFMKDRNEDSQPNIVDGLDIGYEPFTTSARLDQSEDIWVRNQDDGKYNEGLNAATTNPGITIYQNPVYGQTNYIYVRVRNRSCMASTGNEMLTVNWAKKSTALSWPTSFNGTGMAPSPCTAGLVMGNYVTPVAGVSIPAIVPGGQTIVKIAWNPPNPADYVSCGIDTADAWNFCLLARILATNDPMAFPEVADVLTNVKNNNNIIMRNSSAAADTGGCKDKESVEIGSYSNYPDYYSVHYAVPYQDYGYPITNYADISVYLGQQVYQKWAQGGYQGYGVAPDTTKPYTIRIQSPDAYISHILFQPNERYLIQTDYSYSAAYNDTAHSYFNYDIYQTYDSDSSYSGGVTYEIYKPECPEPYAGNNAPVPCDNSYVNYNAAPVNGATYNWYNASTGQYISSGSSLYVQPTSYTGYQLEVTTCNGCRDYSYVYATSPPTSYPPNYTQNTYYNKVLRWDSVPGYYGQYDLYLTPAQGSSNYNFLQYSLPYTSTYSTAVDYTTIGTLMPNTTYYWYVTNAGQPVYACTPYQFTTGSTYGCDPPLIYGVGRDTTIECPAQPVFPNPYSASVCGIASITYNDVYAPLCGSSYSVTRTWTVADGQGTISTAKQKITVLDKEPPVIAPLPPETSIPCHFAPVFAVAYGYDECGPVTLTYIDEEEHNFCESHTAIRVWTASDGCNTSTAYQRIFIDHTVAPFITPAISMTVQSDGMGNTTQLNAWLDSNGGAELEGDCDEGTHLWSNNFTGFVQVNSNMKVATVTFSVRHFCSPATLTTATFIIISGPCDFNTNINDGNPCTVDACNPATGQVTHTPVNTNDNNVCTIDGCTPSLGIYHIPVNTNDGNPCTIDGCDPVTGVYHHLMPPPTIGSISGIATLCASGAQTLTYHIDPVPGAIAYSWLVPSGVTVLSGQGTTGITVGMSSVAVSNGIKGNLCVVANGPCGTTLPYCISLDINAVKPTQPNSISGNAKVCPGDALTYSVAPINRATSYSWSLPTGMFIVGGAGTNIISVSVNAAYTGGIISVAASNACGTGNPRSKSLSLNMPLTPGAITGPLNGLCGVASSTYNIMPVSNATHYYWSSVNGLGIGSNTGTSYNIDWRWNSIVSVSVSSVNGCGMSMPRNISVNGKPATPGSIAGSTVVCTNGTYTYSTGTVAGATSYTWIVPGGTNIINGQGTKVMTMTYGSVAVGNLTVSVKANNACGSSASRLLNGITVAVCPRMEDATSGMGDIPVLDVFPNPAHDELNVLFTAAEGNHYTLQLLDITGREVITENGTGTGHELLRVLDIRSFAKGMYVVKLISDQGASQIKVILE